jgi:hypothetical protein
VTGRPVEFVDIPEAIHWCPFAAIVLGGQKIHSLDLRREEDQQAFGAVLVENEHACPRCFFPRCCELESIVFARVIARVRCKRCGFKYRWYASETTWRVLDNCTRDEAVANWKTSEHAAADWEALLISDPSNYTKPEERDTAPPTLQEQVAGYRCPICREDLLHPIRYRPGLVRVVCRNSGCRQQWGFNPEQPIRGSVPEFELDAVGGAV